MQDICASIRNTSAIQEIGGVSHYPAAVKNFQDGSTSTHNLKLLQELQIDPHPKYRKCFQSKSHFSDPTLRNDKQVWSTEGDIIDYVCVGSTIIIILILLCVFIFYVIKDHQE